MNHFNRTLLIALMAGTFGLGLAACTADGDSDRKPTVDNIDSDGDGIPDHLDNCPSMANADQADMDGDGVGDVCDPDVDGDGIANHLDNCPRMYNPDQLDSDGDGIGDVCDTDTDTDGDGIDDGIDNCPLVFNPEQSDVDNDGIGDACDTDADGDGVDNDQDNCPFTANADQKDTDGNGIGDACEGDVDGDGVPDDQDNCPYLPNIDQADQDGDGVGDVCDTDRDGDGVPNDTDNCPFVANPGQEDWDGDGVGDACSGGAPDMGDADGDGIPNYLDNCPLVPNPGQEDSDGDGIGDACDTSFTCDATTTYRALDLSQFRPDTKTDGACIGCSISGRNFLADGDSETYAELRMGLAIFYGFGWFKAEALDTSVKITDKEVGFVISDPASQLLNLELLGDFITVRFYNDGKEVDSKVVGGTGLNLDLLGLGFNTKQRFLRVKVKEDLEFDSFRLDFGGFLNANKTFRVHEICTGPYNL